MRNWAGNVEFGAARVVAPTSVAELQEVVASSGLVRAVGTGHSFSRVADTSGTLVSTLELDLPLEALGDDRLVVVPGGATYARLTAALHEEGWALHNLGSLPHISVAGACSTGTHGSGNTNGSLSTAVAAVELVRADGELVRFSDADPQFPGAVLALGCLGVVTRLWLRTEPAYEVSQVVHTGVPSGPLLERLDEVLAMAYSVSVFSTFSDRSRVDGVWLKRRVAPGDGPAPSLLGVPPDTVPRHPVQGMDPAATTAQLGERGPWHHRLPHFRPEFTPSAGEELQSEYYLGREHAAEAFEALSAVGDEIAPVLLVFEMRTVAADDLWLSPSHGRDTVTMHFTWVHDFEAVRPVLEVVEAVLERFDPRPHWGKVFLSRDAGWVAESYPELGRFQVLRNEMDPDRHFGNPFSSRLLG
jgi:xylitol oxidase